MTKKQWGMLCIALLLLGWGAIIALVCLIDPFQIYHQATAFIPPIENNYQIYANAGLAKSYDYDSVVIGSSMTENFKPSQLGELLGGDFIKLSVNAGSPFNHRQMLDMAYEDHEIRTVFYGLDIELMDYYYLTPKCEMPEYLYDNNIFNDVSYWFNTSVLTHYIPKCLKTLGKSDPDQRDTMYTWGDLYPYGRDVVLGDLTFLDGIVEQEPIETAPMLAHDYQMNVEHNILRFVKAHPETQFIFFFPPYSVVRWYQFYARGDLQFYLNQKIAVSNALLAYDNVRIYDFQSQASWITNLDHYIDTSHYGPWISEKMVEMISRDECRVKSAEDLLASGAVIRSLVEQITQQGSVPETFIY